MSLLRCLFMSLWTWSQYSLVLGSCSSSGGSGLLTSSVHSQSGYSESGLSLTASWSPSTR